MLRGGPVHAVALLAFGLAAACAVERERAPHVGDESRIHEPGILDPADPAFHGKLLEETGWDFALCARCHGEDFAGGPAEAPCTTCHEEGPTACDTCHHAIRESGSHAAHLPEGDVDYGACGTCHVVPSRWDAPGHILDARGTVDPPPAEVELSGLALELPDGGIDPGPAAWSRDSGTCSAVYCHGATLGDAAATNVMPRWRHPGEGEAACGTCHGIPPSDHASDACATCHERVVDDAGRIVDASLHVDGVVEVGASPDDGCSACHGSAETPAPPRDVHGGTSTVGLGVGAHAAHVTGAHRLTAPIACAECHLVPGATADEGHIDTPLPAEVFPDGGGPLARAGGATPVWSHAEASCADVHCHGGGIALAVDTSTSRVSEPIWTAVGSGQAACGACHGVPPLDGVHDPAATIRDCFHCHPSVDDHGNILFVGASSRHIDGAVDVL